MADMKKSGTRQKAAAVLVLTLVFSLLNLAPAQSWPANWQIERQACDVDFGCYPTPPVSPPTTCNRSNIPAGHLPLTITGQVVGPGDEPIAGACVYWQYGSATTEANGIYQISVWADQPVILLAYKQLYTWNYLELQPDSMLTADKTIRLSFLHSTYVTPKAINDPPRAMSLSLYSTAPAADSRVLVHASEDTVIQLTQDASYGVQSGWTRWLGSWTSPSNSVDGRYYMTSCVLRNDAVGDCLSQTFDSVVLSQVEEATRRPFYDVDRVAPVLSPNSPSSDGNTIDRRPSIAASGSDDRSGIDFSRGLIELDGTQVATGSISFYPPTDLALGLHRVTVSGFDLAGNSSSVSWTFNVISADLNAGMAAIPRVEVSFPPGVSQVNIPSIPVIVKDSKITLSSSIRGGIGDVTVATPFYYTYSTFRQGALEQTVYTSLPSRNYVSSFAVLAPSAEPLTIQVAGRTLNAGPITLSVPQAFQLTGGVVQLEVAESPVNIFLNTNNVLSSLPDCTSSRNCEVSGTIECVLAVTQTAGTNSGVANCESTLPQVYLNVVGVKYYVAGAQSDLNLHSTTSRDPDPHPLHPDAIYPDPGGQPVCGTEQGYVCENVLQKDLGGLGSTARQRTYWSTGENLLGLDHPSLFSAFGHHFSYRARGGPEDNPLSSPLISVWQQSDVHAGNTPCVMGKPQQVYSNLVKFANSVNTENLTPTGTNVTTTVTDNLPSSGLLPVVMTKERAGTQIYAVGSDADLRQVQDGRGGVSGSLTGGLGRAYSSDGQLVTATGSAYNLWEPNDGVRNKMVEIMSGTEFSQTTSAGFTLRPAIYLHFRYDNSECLGV